MTLTCGRDEAFRVVGFSPYRSGVLSASRSGAQLSFLSGSAVSENCANFASSIGLKLALTRSAFRMTLFCISVSVVLALSTVAPNLRAADATREQVIDVVKKFAHSWETGDLAAFTSTLDEHLLWAHPGGKLDRNGAIAFFKRWRSEWLNTRIYPTTFLVEGDQVFAEYQFCSTNKQTGKREAEGTAAIGEIRGGKLVLWKEYYDHSVGELQAKDVIPVDEGNVSFPYPAAAKNRW
jgi:ketosteroid isomerase-like protein